MIIILAEANIKISFCSPSTKQVIVETTSPPQRGSPLGVKKLSEKPIKWKNNKWIVETCLYFTGVNSTPPEEKKKNPEAKSNVLRLAYVFPTSEINDVRKKENKTGFFSSLLLVAQCNYRVPVNLVVDFCPSGESRLALRKVEDPSV